MSADDRCWIFRKLTKILISDAGPPIDVPGLIGCGEYRDDVPNIFKYKSTGDANTKEVFYFIFEVRDFVFNLKANPCLHLISNNFDEVMIFLVFFLSRLDVPFASTGLVCSR